MKKALLVVLLLALCLSLAACELPFDLPFDLPFQNNGSGCFLYDSLESEDYYVALNLIAEVAINPTDLDNRIGDVQVLEEKHPELASMIKASNYDGAYCYVLSLLHKSGKGMEKWDTSFCKEAEAVTFTDWYTVAMDDKVSSVVTLRKDGVCTINGKDYYWLASGAAGTADRMLPIFELYDGVEPKYKVDIVYADHIGMYYMSFRDIPQSIYAVYVNDKTQVFDASGTWLTPDKQPGNVEKVEIAGNQVFLDGVAYTAKNCRLDVGGNEEWAGSFLTFELWDEADGHYGNVEIYNVKGAWCASLYTVSGHQTVNYYKEGPDYDRGLAIYNYERALAVLPLLKGAENGLDYNGDERSYQQWLDYIYNAMAAADGYGDSTQILKNFSKLEDMFVGITTEPDEFNHHMEQYKYDASGRLVYANDKMLTLLIYGTPDLTLPVAGEEGYYETVSNQYYFEYNLRGRISRILHKDGNNLVSTITPTYDAQGSIKRLDIQMANGETRVANFTYDYDMMPRSVGSNTFLSGDSVPRSISYGDYFLEFAWTPDPNGDTLSGMVGWISYHLVDASYTEEYIYDNGRLTGRRITITRGDMVDTEEYIYTYDEEGKIASEQCTVTSGENSWSNTRYYIYQDIYFYDFEPKDDQDEEQNNKIIQYEKALDVLSLLKNCNGDLVYEGEQKTQQEWLAFVRQAMIDAAGYGESNRILANFSQLENVLVGISTDPNGGNYYKEYRYDAAGRVIFANDKDYTKFIYGTLEVESTHYYFFEYDDQGRISRILHKNGEALFATITVTCDNRGNVKRLDILMANGDERFAGFAYDYDMMPHTILEEDEWYDDEIEEPVDMDNVLRTISFGDQFMDFAWTPDFDGYTFSGLHAYLGWDEEGYAYSENVTYDDQERVVTKTIYINDVVTTVCTYTYDANGNLVSETQTTDGQTVTYYYIYQNILVYNFDAQ